MSEKAASVSWPDGHEEEQGDEMYQGSWCASDEHEGEVHDGVEQYPEWPCAVVLSHTGDADAEAYWRREGEAWAAWYRQQQRTASRRTVLLNWRWLRRVVIANAEEVS